jgi:alpha-L-rhamnosidase
MHTTLPRVGATRCESTFRPLGVETLSPRLTWRLHDVIRQSAYQIQVATSPSDLVEGKPDLWDSGRIESSQSVLVPYAGVPLTSRTRAYWRVRVWNEQGVASDYSAIDWFEMGLLQKSDWSAQWIGRPGVHIGNYAAPVLPSPIFRKSFELAPDAVSARAYVCGLGYFELYLNGQRVGDHVLDPIVTQYEKHVGYISHDISGMVRDGENVVSMMLGNGWYNTHSTDVWHFDKASWREYPKLILQLEVTYADGRVERITSNSSWRVTDGPLVFDGLRNGETYDAREEKTGWNAAGYDDSEWQQAQVVAGPPGELFSQQAPPCRVVEAIEAVSIKEVKPNVWVFDFGQNIAGWVKLKVAGEAGTEVTLRYGERITETGELDQQHIATFISNGDFQTDRLILAGRGEESFETRFTYHGFQWVQVEGLPSAPTSETLIALVVQSDFASAGEFSSSDETLNSLQKLTLWAYRGNFVGIPTDCPHREKNGWTGDAQLACETGLYNFDAATAYAHWLGSIADAQRPSGQLPGIIPTGGWGFNWGNGPAWDSALIIIPWQMYLFQGDKFILETLYDNMKRYVDFAFNLADDGLIKYGLGDWCAPDMTKTAHRDLVTTAILCGDCQIMSKVAAIVGKHYDIEHFDSLGEQLRSAWRAAFLNEDGGIANNDQTSLGGALHYGLLDECEMAGVAQRLRQAVADANYQPTFGIVGAKWVPRALADAGYVEEAFQLMRNEEYPGWVHWLKQGATTLWEHWHGRSSRNHIMFGDISAWMYKYLGGISPIESYPAFERFTVEPKLVSTLQWASAKHNCSYGQISSEWKRDGDSVEFRVVVPENTVALWKAPLKESVASQELEAGTNIFRYDLSVLR